MESSFCRRLPKLELHAHLNGSLSRNTLKELYKLHQQENNNAIESWDSLVFPSNIPSLSEFFDLFKTTYKLTATPEAVQIATERVIQDFHDDNVIYLELRSTLRKEKNMTKRNYIESMIKGVINCRQSFPNIKVKLLVSINRKEAVKEAEENVKLAIEYSKKYSDIVVGIDTSGNPTNNNFKDFLHILKLARSEGLKISVHCAEVQNNDEVKDILDFLPERLGHCTCIHDSFGGNESNWKLLLEKKIPVELCITSNLKCGTVKSIDNHHFKLLYAKDHPIALGTDDKGVFGSTLSEEFEVVHKAFGLSEQDLWKISLKSIDYIFATYEEKESLRMILFQWKVGEPKSA